MNESLIRMRPDLATAAHDAYFWVDDGNMPHWTVDAEEGGCYGYGEICQQI